MGEVLAFAEASDRFSPKGAAVGLALLVLVLLFAAALHNRNNKGE